MFPIALFDCEVIELKVKFRKFSLFESVVLNFVIEQLLSNEVENI